MTKYIPEAYLVDIEDAHQPRNHASTKHSIGEYMARIPQVWVGYQIVRILKDMRHVKSELALLA
jgi:hypothetical protein